MARAPVGVSAALAALLVALTALAAAPRATAETAPHRALRSSGAGSCSGYPHKRVVRVSSGSKLQSAMHSARSGDLIVLAPGKYKYAYGFELNGKTGVTVCGPRSASLAPSTRSSHALDVVNCKNVKIVGVTLRDGTKGALGRS